ncbi:hypothetical protein B0H11DRAFT_2020248 [Mycena galericulata]|nr:hypothetical protein B0H11DRAFT_2020248 [Mycena galericulata]
MSSTMTPRPRHVTPLASEPSITSLRERRVSELDVATQPMSPHVVQHRSPPLEPAQARNPAPKPRSRRCFVCGTTGKHPLDFRVCPRTAVLLRRSLARINDNGRLVLWDGSPLPMTRHPGGVAAHLLSRFRNPTRIVPEPPDSPPAPRAARDPPNSVFTNPRERVEHTQPTFNSSSPHAIPPVDRVAPAPEHVPLRRIAPHDPTNRHPSDSLSRARASFLVVLLESLLDSAFRRQLCVIIGVLDGLGAQDPSTLRERIQPVFARISHFVPP